MVNGPLLESLRTDSAIEQITLGAFVDVNINGKHVRTVAMTPVRGAALLSTLDGRLPRVTGTSCWAWPRCVPPAPGWEGRSG